MIRTIESECFISAQHCYVSLKLVKDRSRIPFCPVRSCLNKLKLASRCSISNEISLIVNPLCKPIDTTYVGTLMSNYLLRDSGRWSGRKLP